MGIISRPGIICGSTWGSFPVRGSFAGWDHLRACTDVDQFTIRVRYRIACEQALLGVGAGGGKRKSLLFPPPAPTSKRACSQARYRTPDAISGRETTARRVPKLPLSYIKFRTCSKPLRHRADKSLPHCA